MQIYYGALNASDNKSVKTKETIFIELQLLRAVMILVREYVFTSRSGKSHLSEFVEMTPRALVQSSCGGALF